MDLERIQLLSQASMKILRDGFSPLDRITFFELVSLQNRLFGISGDFCHEIGVFQGKSLVFLSLLKSDNEKLFGFDLFDGDTKKITQENLAQEGSTEKRLFTERANERDSTNGIGGFSERTAPVFTHRRRP